MALRPDHEAAASISVAGCDACRCGNLTIRLHDRAGDIFAWASMPVEIGEAFIAQVSAEIARAKRSGLAAIACEGSA